MTLRVVITTPLEEDLVEGLIGANPGVEVIYPAPLIPAPRYPAEHRYPNFDSLSTQDQQEWEDLIASADVLFDFGPAPLRATLANRPQLRWIQATSAGVGSLVAHIGLADKPDPLITTASGVHAGPIAEYVILAMLWFRKNGRMLQQRQQEHRWERLAVDELAGTMATIVGLGRVGEAIALRCQAMGVEVVGCGRQPRANSPWHYVTMESLDQWLPRSDFVVLCLPDTAETKQVFDADRIAKLRSDSILINVGRGTTVDEPALIDALQHGRLGGAFLDVAAHEPLEPESPLWDMPQVLITPHSISTVPAENARIVEIFQDNLSRFQEGLPLLNLFDKKAGY